MKSRLKKLSSGANWMSGDKNPILLMLQEDENVTTTLDCKRNTTRQEQKEENDRKIFNQNFENITDVYRTGNKHFFEFWTNY